MDGFENPEKDMNFTETENVGNGEGIEKQAESEAFDGEKEQENAEGCENKAECGCAEESFDEAEETEAEEDGTDQNEKCEEKKHCKDGKEKGHCRRELQKTREELEKLKAETEDVKRKWYSVTAEYENYRRRTQNQAAQRYTEGRSDVISALFPIGDNLERALVACPDEKTRQGIEMVLKSYKKVLEGENVEELDPIGQPFDSAVAEAIMAVPAEEGEEAGLVKQVYVKGYKRGDKVLRYAQVIVTQ